MDICESCYEKMVEKFVIPPEEKQVTEFVYEKGVKSMPGMLGIAHQMANS